jgi:hypothetical protein
VSGSPPSFSRRCRTERPAHGREADGAAAWVERRDRKTVAKKKKAKKAKKR